MESKKLRKGQSLPLNTIVIALLVIIVLVVIIVFFTNSVAETGDTINKNSISGCSMDNPAIKSVGYTDVEKVSSVGQKDGNIIKPSCKKGYEEIPFIKEVKTETERIICCGKK